MLFVGNVREEAEPWKRIPMKITVGDFARPRVATGKMNRKGRERQENTFRALQPEKMTKRAKNNQARQAGGR